MLYGSAYVVSRAKEVLKDKGFCSLFVINASQYDVLC